MRIVFIITGLDIGGAEMMLLKLLERLDRQRFEPYVISLMPLGELASSIRSLDISVQSVNMGSGIFDIGAFFKLVRLLKVLKPDVVHTWMYHADLLGGIAARLAGINALGWCIRNSNLDADKTKFGTRAIVRLCGLLSPWLPRLIVSCSEQAKGVHIAKGYVGDKILVIPNGFDLSLFKPDESARASVRAKLGLSKDTLLVGLIGRFDPQKNHVGFFKAATQLNITLPQVCFLLAGKGIDRSNDVLVQAATDAGVLNKSYFMGLLRDIPRLMASLDVLVSSSSYGEAFPNVLGEAMACGVPCVVTDAGDSAYIVADTGRSVAINDMSGLAAAIKELLNLSAEEKRDLGENARARVAKNFEISQVVRQYEDFYLQLCADCEG